MPDLVGISQYGVVYTGHKGKIAEHGGDHLEDRNVPIVITGPGIAPNGFNTTPVETTQIAPTILQLLGIRPTELASRGHQPHRLTASNPIVEPLSCDWDSECAIPSQLNGQPASNVVRGRLGVRGTNIYATPTDRAETSNPWFGFDKLKARAPDSLRFRGVAARHASAASHIKGGMRRGACL